MDAVREKLNLEFDPRQLAERYAAERDKRVRRDGASQFIEVGFENNASYLMDDPYHPQIERQPKRISVDVLLIGGGWVGLVTGARLVEAGVEDFLIVESGSDFGGTWYWNRYPGAQCDIQSYAYLPLLEETGYMPKERYSYAPEIYEHARRIGNQYSLYEKSLFQTWVTDMTWNEDSQVWVVTTNRGDEIRANVVSLGTGSAPRPKLPGVEGIETFKGRTFHTSRWDYDFTGGGPEGNLSKLADKKVAVIGTGATGIQCIPHVAASAEHTYVIQRTPSSVSPRGNAPTDPEWFKSQPPGWQAELMLDFDRMRRLQHPKSEAMQHESLLNLVTRKAREFLELADAENLTEAERTNLLQLADFATMEEVRKRVDNEVTNKRHAELLKPWYNVMCKRPTFNDDYLQAFNHPNVTLVDVSATKGVERITPTGFIAGGQHYDVDCIVYASGFEITSDFKRRIGIPITGRGGLSIYDHWGAGMRTMHGLMVNGFPNFFMLGGLFGFTLGLNYSAVIDDQVAQLIYVLKEMKARGITSAEPTRAAEDEWIEDQTMVTPDDLPNNLGGTSDACTPGYFNHEGAEMSTRRNYRQEAYVKGGLAYAQKLAQWRANGDLSGLHLHNQGTKHL